MPTLAFLSQTVGQKWGSQRKLGCCGLTRVWREPVIYAVTLTIFDTATAHFYLLTYLQKLCTSPIWLLCHTMWMYVEGTQQTCESVSLALLHWGKIDPFLL